MDNRGYTCPELLTTPEALDKNLANPRLCLIDTRPAEQFARGLIPGAVHFDLFGISLVDTSPAPLKAFMSMMRHLFELRGINLEKEIVFYEETSGMRAARGLWFLEYFGHRNVHILDGGFRAWRQTGHPVSTEPTPPKSTQFTGEERPELLATAGDVLDSLKKEKTFILDTRSDDEYMGRKIRAARGGAIPGAVHIEWTHNLEKNGSFKSAEDLQAMYQKAGVTSDKEIFAYCQGGYRSAHSYLALRLLGYPKIRNYIGSWKEWGDRLDLPIDKPWEKK
ncbi:MAG: sulfurtransferase [Candidatus Binatia bacterium]